MERVDEQIKGLLQYVNEQTANEFSRLGDAVKWLVEQVKDNIKK